MMDTYWMQMIGNALILMNVLPIMAVEIPVLTQRVLTHVTVVRGMYLITMVLSIHQTGQSPIHHLIFAVRG
jgi:hypothetical protein